MDIFECMRLTFLTFLTQLLRHFSDIDRSMVCRWKKEKHTIEEAAANSRHNLFSKLRRSHKHQQLFTKLYEEFLSQNCDAKVFPMHGCRLMRVISPKPNRITPKQSLGDLCVLNSGNNTELKFAESAARKPWTRRVFKKNS